MVNIIAAVKSVDIFGRPICLNYQSRDYFQTLVGGFSTICLIILLVIYSRNGLINVLDKKSINYELKTTKSNDPQQLQLKGEQFMFAIRLQQNDFLKNPYLNLTVIQTNQTTDNNGKSNRTVQLIQMEPCTLSHWQNFIDHEEGEPQTILKRYNLVDALCPSASNFLSVGGNFFNTQFNYIRLSFATCISNTVQCKTDAELSAQINSVGYLRVQLFFPAIVINPSQENYYHKSIDDSFHFTFIPNTNVVSSDIFIQVENQKRIVRLLNYNLQNESLILKSNSDQIKQEEFLTMDSRYKSEYQAGKKTGQHAVFFLRRGANTFTYQRSFKSIQSFLSELGGIAQVFISAMSVCFFLFYGILFKISLINELYDIEYKNKKYVSLTNEIKSKEELQSDTQQNLTAEQTQKNLQQKDDLLPSPLKNSFSKKISSPKEKENQIFSASYKDNQNQQLKINQVGLSTQGLYDTNQNEYDEGNKYSINNAVTKTQNNSFIQGVKNIQKEGFSPRENRLLSPRKSVDMQEKTNQLWIKFYNMINQYAKVTISFKYILHLLTCRKYFNDQLFSLVCKSLVHINQDLDISTILFKLQEIEKLKTVLLNENQRNLFSFFPKPLIRLQEPLQRKQSIHNSPKHFLSIWKSKMQDEIKASRKGSDSSIQKLQRKASMKKEFTQKQHLFTTPKHFTELDSFRILHQSYQQILCDNSEISPSNQMINERLVTCLGNDLLEIFKIQTNEASSPSSRFNFFRSPQISRKPTFPKSIQQLNKMRLFKVNSEKKSDMSLSIQDEEDKDLKTIEKIYVKEIQPNELTTMTNQMNLVTQFNLEINDKQDINFRNREDGDDEKNKNEGDNSYSLGYPGLPTKLFTHYNFKNNSNCKNSQLELEMNLK